VSNRILADPNGPTYSGPCGLSEGISIDDGSTAAFVAHNIIRAFRLVGIIVHNADARVINNSVQYWHQIEVNARGRAHTSAALAPAVPSLVTGIRVYQSTGIVDLNGITSAPDGQTPQVRLQHGISTSGVDGVRIRKNDIRLADFGMWLETSDNLRVIGNVIVGPNRPIPTGKRSKAMPASYTQSGILAFSGSGSRFADNNVLHNYTGMDATTSTTGATVTGNDFTGNMWDCVDGSGNPANAWSDNVGNADIPNGLCTDGPVQVIPGSPT
jgi:nitrous oxidase accessory protein NosD